MPKARTPLPDTCADWFMGTLVTAANVNGEGPGITLLIGGFLVSGILVGGKQYFEGLAAHVAEGIEDPTEAQDARESFARFGKVYEADVKDVSAPAFIHLQDARFFNTSGRPIPENEGVWWRGRLSEVSGFVLGTLSAEES